MKDWGENIKKTNIHTTRHNWLKSLIRHRRKWSRTEKELRPAHWVHFGSSDVYMNSRGKYKSVSCSSVPKVSLLPFQMENNPAPPSRSSSRPNDVSLSLCRFRPHIIPCSAAFAANRPPTDRRSTPRTDNIAREELAGGEARGNCQTN